MLKYITDCKDNFLMGYVRNKDVKAATVLPEVGSDGDDDDLGDDWDAI